MAAGLGFKTFTTGEVLTAADTNGYLMQGINVFANSAARAAAITSPQEGQYSYLKDTNALEYYDGAAWVGAPVGDITAVTAGKGLTGGGSSGDVTVSLATSAKGDLVVGTGTTTAAALTVGNNGETLVADSSTSTGLRYTAGTVQANPILNSAFQVWQRGTTNTTTTVYTADRWFFYSASGTGRRVTRQATNDTTNLPFIQYCARVQRDSGNTATNALTLSQPIETINTIPFSGKTVTLSFYARKGADLSSTSGNISVFLATGTGTDQNQQVGGYTGQALPINTTATLTTTWQRFTFTAAIGSTATEMQPIFDFVPTGTAGAADYFEITGVQIDIGSVALPFRTYAATIQGELAACQRYYVRFGGPAYNIFTTAGFAGSTTVGQGYLSMPVQMRVPPTAIDYAGTIAFFDSANGSYNTSSLALDSGLLGNKTIGINGAITGATQGRFGYLRANNDTNAYVGLSAEL